MLIDLTLEVNPNHSESPIAKMGHFGTHIDVMDQYAHIPIDKFFCNTTLIDISDIRERLIEKNDLLHRDIQKDDFVIFRANWMNDYGYMNRAYHTDHPHFSDQAIDYLISKQIRFLGLDFPGAQRKEKHKLVDQKCANHGIFIIENLNNLTLLDKDRFFTYCFPMNLSGMSGIPIRVVAKL